MDLLYWTFFNAPTTMDLLNGPTAIYLLKPTYCKGTTAMKLL